MATAVNIYLTDNSTSPAPIINAVVSVLDPATFTLIATAATDGSGKASFLLPGAVVPGLAYEVRFYKLGVIFSNPQSISIVEPINSSYPNGFTFTGTLLNLLPVATDPRCCRCTGRLFDFSNKPVANSLVRIMALADYGKQTPKVVDGNLISMEALELHSDSNGFISVDLFRTGKYYLTYAGEDDTAWPMLVPDRASVNLIDLIFPFPVLLTYDQVAAPGNAVTVPAGTIVFVNFGVLFTNYQTLGPGDLTPWTVMTVGDPSIASPAITATGLSILGVAPGTTTVTTALVNPLNVPVQVPAKTFTAPTLTVTVV